MQPFQGGSCSGGTVRASWHFMGNVNEEKERKNGCISDMAQISCIATLEDNS